jgi:hypothetical protein
VSVTHKTESYTTQYIDLIYAHINHKQYMNQLLYNANNIDLRYVNNIINILRF